MFNKKKIIHFSDIQQNINNCLYQLNGHSFSEKDRSGLVQKTLREYFHNYDVDLLFFRDSDTGRLIKMCTYDKKSFRYYFESEKLTKVESIKHYKHLTEREKGIHTELFYNYGPYRISDEQNQEYLTLREIVDEEYKVKYTIVAQMSEKLWNRKYYHSNVNDVFLLTGPVLVKPFKSEDYLNYIDGKIDYLECKITVFILK